MASHSHEHPPHDHGHPHGQGSPRAFFWGVLLNSGLSGLQLAIGIGFGSLALIGDAIHNLGDVAGLLLGWGAERLSARPATARFTYGFGRSTQLASLMNAALILMAAGVVIVEGVQRLLAPVPVVSGPVALAAAAGIGVNLLSAHLFGTAHHHDLNRRAAVVHLLTDAAVSAAVLVSAVLVGLVGWLWLDAATAIGVGLAVAWSGWELLMESLSASLDAVPRGVDLAAVEAALRDLPGVENVHHLHVWGMSTSRAALTAHLVGREGGPLDAELLSLAQQRLAPLGITHSTLQIEATGSCAEDGAHQPR